MWWALRHSFQLDKPAPMTGFEGRLLNADPVDISDTAAQYAEIIATSELFDAEGYTIRAGLSLKDADPAAHYLVHGESQG